MTEHNAFADRPAHRENDGAAEQNVVDAATRFFDEIHSLPKFMDKSNDYYQPNPEYKNGLASEKFLDIEKWVDDTKKCNLEISQDTLASKLSEFGKEAEDKWKTMDDDPDQWDAKNQDTYMTYSRFGKVFDLLDESHRDKVLETLPWRLRPGE